MYYPNRPDLLAQGFVASGGSINTPVSTLMPVPTNSMFPVKSTYTDERDWFVAMVKYAWRKAWPIFNRRLAMNRLALDMVKQTTEFSSVPTYAQTPDGQPISPVEWEFVSSIAPMLKTMAGEFVSKETVINAHVSTQEAVSRAAETMKGLLFDKFLKSVKAFPDLISQYNLPNSEAILKEFDGDVNAWMNRRYRDILAVFAERMINGWMKESGFDRWLMQTYMLYVITDQAVASPYIDPVTLKVVNPLIHTDRFIPDVTCKDNFFSDQKFFISYEYLAPETIVMMYPHLSYEEVKRYVGSRGGYLGLPDVSNLDTKNYVLVIRCQFIYPEEKITDIDIDYPDEIGEDGISVVSKSERISATQRYEQLYECHLIGGNLLAYGGPVEYQLRSRKDPAKANLGARVLVQDFSLDPQMPNGLTRLSGLVHWRNWALFKLTEYVSQIQGVYIEIDERLIPQNPDAQSPADSFVAFMNNMRQNRVILVNKSEIGDSISPNDTAVKVVDMNGRVNDVIIQLQNAVNFLDEQIRAQMNFNPARSGNSGQYTAAGVNKENLTQSDYGTAYALHSFERFLEQVLTDVANLLKIAFVTKRERALSGDMYAMESYQADLMQYGDVAEAITTPILLEDIGINIKRRHNQEELRETYKEMIMMFAQQQTPPELIKLFINAMNADSADDMRDVIVSMVDAMQKKQEQQAMQEQQMAQQQQMQAQNMQIQGQMAQQQQGANNDLRNQAMLEQLKASLTPPTQQ